MKKITVIICCSLAIGFCLPKSGFSYSISNIILTPPSPASLPFNSLVSAQFDYYTDVDAYIRVMPYTNGDLSPNIAFFALLPQYQAGSGTINRLIFSIMPFTNAVVVDQIKFLFEVDRGGPLLYETFTEVNYVFDNPVPIPGAIWLLGSGLVGLVGLRRKRK